jgi:hypothetical protein
MEELCKGMSAYHKCGNFPFFMLSVVIPWETIQQLLKIETDSEK